MVLMFSINRRHLTDKRELHTNDDDGSGDGGNHTRTNCNDYQSAQEFSTIFFQFTIIYEVLKIFE